MVDSGSNDNIFIYYAGHGSPGVITMPTVKKKHGANSYKNMVLPSIWSVHAITTANGHEISYAAYYPGQHPSPSSYF
ncbi:hypothetical protein Peur_043738 [Populus x canadensis]